MRFLVLVIYAMGTFAHGHTINSDSNRPSFYGPRTPYEARVNPDEFGVLTSGFVNIKGYPLVFMQFRRFVEFASQTAVGKSMKGEFDSALCPIRALPFENKLRAFLNCSVDSCAKVISDLESNVAIKKVHVQKALQDAIEKKANNQKGAYRIFGYGLQVVVEYNEDVSSELEDLNEILAQPKLKKLNDKNYFLCGVSFWENDPDQIASSIHGFTVVNSFPKDPLEIADMNGVITVPYLGGQRFHAMYTDISKNEPHIQTAFSTIENILIAHPNVRRTAALANKEVIQEYLRNVGVTFPSAAGGGTIGNGRPLKAKGGGTIGNGQPLESEGSIGNEKNGDPGQDTSSLDLGGAHASVHYFLPTAIRNAAKKSHLSEDQIRQTLGL